MKKINENIESVEKLRKEVKEETKFYNFSKRDLEKPIWIKSSLYVLISLLVIFCCYCGYDYYKKNSINLKPKTNPTTEIDDSKNTIDLSSMKFEGNGGNISNNVITINKDGDYTITGTTNDGNIVVNAEGEVTLILDNASITSKTTAAIMSKNCELLKITLKDNTENIIQDNKSNSEEAAIVSTTKLKINGNGTLLINGKSKKGILIKNNDLTIENGKLAIKAETEGLAIEGNTTGILTFNGGNTYITSNLEGIISSNDIVINNGSIFIISGSNSEVSAINSKNLYLINGGTIVALSNGLIQQPTKTSTQRVILFKLEDKINRNKIVSLFSDNTELITFAAEKDFNTITISTPQLSKGIYSLYYGGSYSKDNRNGIYSGGSYSKGNSVKINKNSEFEVIDMINYFGK